MANPRIDELRRRLEREPGSRLFGQLAEELRKDGDLAEAIRVARTGLAAHPNYPSARMTLGRALFDTGELAAARGELELVLRGAPDNILASRMLAECLEGLGDFGAALLQYRVALRLAPGDRQTEVQIRALEQRLAAGGARATAAPPPPLPQVPQARSAPPTPPVAVAAPPLAPRLPSAAGPSAPPLVATRPSPPPDPAADFDDVFETAPSWQRQVGASPGPEVDDAILLLEDEAPTLPGSPFVAKHSVEVPAKVDAPRPEAPPTPPPPPPPTPVAAREPEAPPKPGPQTLTFEVPPVIPPQAPLTVAFDRAPTIDEHVSFEAPAERPVEGADTLAGTPAFAPPLARPVGDSTAAFAAFSAAIPPPGAVPMEALPPSAPVAPAMAPEPASARVLAAPPLPPEDPPAVSSPTLAELYFDQGFPDKAIQVYEELLEREPQNERARARLIEIKALSRHLTEDALTDPRAERRLVLERKIARLEEMLAAVRRG